MKYYRIDRVHCVDGSALQNVTAAVVGDWLVVDRGPDQSPDWYNVRGIDWLESVTEITQSTPKNRVFLG